MVLVDVLEPVLTWAFGSVENLGIALATAYGAHHARKAGTLAATSMSTLFWIALLAAGGVVAGVIDVGQLHDLLAALWAFASSFL